MDRIFLDANVLFSAAYREGAGLLRLWDLAGVVQLTSGYALEEARRNLRETTQRLRLDGLVARLEVIWIIAPRPLPEHVQLPEKDRPILWAALHAGATHLLTGDVRRFGALFGHAVEGVRILPPAEYLRGRAGRG